MLLMLNMWGTVLSQVDLWGNEMLLKTYSQQCSDLSDGWGHDKEYCYRQIQFIVSYLVDYEMVELV